MLTYVSFIYILINLNLSYKLNITYIYYIKTFKSEKLTITIHFLTKLYILKEELFSSSFFNPKAMQAKSISLEGRYGISLMMFLNPSIGRIVNERGMSAMSRFTFRNISRSQMERLRSYVYKIYTPAKWCQCWKAPAVNPVSKYVALKATIEFSEGHLQYS